MEDKGSAAAGARENDNEEISDLPVASCSSPPISSTASRISVRILASRSRSKAGGEIGRHVGLLPRVVLCSRVAVLERLLSSVFVVDGSAKKGGSLCVDVRLRACV